MKTVKAKKVRNEVSGLTAKRIASKVMLMAKQSKKNRQGFDDDTIWANSAGSLSIGEAETLAGSVLTQAKDSPDKWK